MPMPLCKNLPATKWDYKRRCRMRTKKRPLSPCSTSIGDENCPATPEMRGLPQTFGMNRLLLVRPAHLGLRLCPPAVMLTPFKQHIEHYSESCVAIYFLLGRACPTLSFVTLMWHCNQLNVPCFGINWPHFGSFVSRLNFCFHQEAKFNLLINLLPATQRPVAHKQPLV